MHLLKIIESGSHIFTFTSFNIVAFIWSTPPVLFLSFSVIVKTSKGLAGLRKIDFILYFVLFLLYFLFEELYLLASLDPTVQKYLLNSLDILLPSLVLNPSMSIQSIICFLFFFLSQFFHAHISMFVYHHFLKILLFYFHTLV